MVPFEEEQKKLQSGDKIIYYTDGVVEFQNEKGNFYGAERLHKVLMQKKNEPIAGILEAVIADIMDFGMGLKPQDDISLIGLEYKKEPF